MRWNAKNNHRFMCLALDRLSRSGIGIDLALYNTFIGLGIVSRVLRYARCNLHSDHVLKFRQSSNNCPPNVTNRSSEGRLQRFSTMGTRRHLAGRDFSRTLAMPSLIFSRYIYHLVQTPGQTKLYVRPRAYRLTISICELRNLQILLVYGSISKLRECAYLCILSRRTSASHSLRARSWVRILGRRRRKREFPCIVKQSLDLLHSLLVKISIAKSEDPSKFDGGPLRI